MLPFDIKRCLIRSNPLSNYSPFEFPDFVVSAVASLSARGLRPEKGLRSEGASALSPVDFAIAPPMPGLEPCLCFLHRGRVSRVERCGEESCCRRFHRPSSSRSSAANFSSSRLALRGSNIKMRPRIARISSLSLWRSRSRVSATFKKSSLSFTHP